MTLKFYVLLVSALLPSFCIADDKVVYGLSEQVYIEDIKLKLPARLDTGAKTASLSARNIERFERDGEPWVRFFLAYDGAPSTAFEHPVVRVSKIKRRAADMKSQNDEAARTSTKRPVIELSVCMGKARQKIEVNLTDRSRFEFPLLIGSEALKDFNALIDPAHEYMAGKPGCSATTTGSDN